MARPSPHPPLVTAQPGWWRERPQTEHAELSPRGRSRRRPEALAHARLRRPRPPAQAKLSSARETGLVDPIPPCSRATATGPPTGRSARASRTARPPQVAEDGCSTQHACFRARFLSLVLNELLHLFIPKCNSCHGMTEATWFVCLLACWFKPFCLDSCCLRKTKSPCVHHPSPRNVFKYN